MPNRIRNLTLVATLAWGMAACSPTAGTTTPAPEAGQGGVRVEGDRTTGGGDLLGAELLLAGGAGTGSLYGASTLADPALTGRAEAAALDHLRSVAFGAGSGPEMAGSRRIQRLALEAGAPPDLNHNGSNWDEVLAAERNRIVAAAGATPLSGTWQTFLPWQHARTELAQPLAEWHLASWRAVDDGDRTVALADVGGAMSARARAVHHLLRQGRGALAGANAEQGRLGLELLHQLLAIEETLLGAWFTAGGALGALADPEQYDPLVAPAWLPTAVAVDLDPGLPGAPTGYRTLDGDSDLLALARVLRACAELSLLAADQNPHPDLHRLFRGHPFEVAPPAPPSGPSWDNDIRPLIVQRCASCHDNGQAGFFTNTYQSMLLGGNKVQAQNLQMVVPGNHQASVLYLVVTTPPPTFQRMPPGPNGLLAPQIQLLADWIDQGAPEHPVSLPPPPRPGEVLANVLFRNLVAFHLDRQSGALHHRFDGQQGSGIATAAATGAVLDALAVLAVAQPDLEQQGLKAADVLALAAEFASANLVDTSGNAHDDLDLAQMLAGPPARLDGQVALTGGLLAAIPFATGTANAPGMAQAMLGRLLNEYRHTISGLFREAPGFDGARYDAGLVADVLLALRRAAEQNLLGASTAPEALLATLLPLLTPAEWRYGGEVLGDGIADTDGNGVPEPAFAGGAHGRLPLLGRSILVGRTDDRPTAARITWTAHVRPLFVQKCGDCHLNGNELGGYRLDTVALAGTAGESGGQFPLLVPGDPEGSLLYRKLVDRTPAIGVQMPQARPPVDASAAAIVHRWILDGATAR